MLDYTNSNWQLEAQTEYRLEGMPESKSEVAEGSLGHAMATMEQEDSCSSDKYSASIRADGSHCQALSSQQRHYNSSHSSNRRTYPQRFMPSLQHSRVVSKPSLYTSQPTAYPKKNRFAYELDGQQKFIQKKGYFENLRCPSCIMNNLAQTYKHQGIPWCDHSVNYRTKFNDLYEALNAELEDFYKFIRPNNEDEVLRKATFFCISKSIKRSKLVDAVKYYGSYSSGTYLPVSDIDLVVYSDPSNDVLNVLRDIARFLFFDGIIEKHCSFIPNSRIPLLKFYDCVTGFPINITVNTPNVMERADYIRENIRKNSSSYMLKILYFMKYYLLYKGSNQVYHGGIGSYALSLMVIRFFQESSTKELIDIYEMQRPATLLARLLIGFLQRYSDLDFVRNHTISVRDGGQYIPTVPFPDNPFPNPLFNKKTSILRIEDHLEPWKNVSSGSFNSDLILSDFGHLLKILLNPDQCHSDNHVSILGNALCVVDSFVDYRDILDCVYRHWFKHSNSSSLSKCFNSEKYDQFTLYRNIFGRRSLEYDFKRFDDNTIEMITKEKLDSSVRYSTSPKNSLLIRNYNDAYNYPTYSTYSYHHSQFGGIQNRHEDRNSHIRTRVSQRYPSDSISQVSTETNESSNTREFKMNHKKSSKAEQNSNLSMTPRLDVKRTLLPIENNGMAYNKQAYEPKAPYRRKYKPGQFSNYGDNNQQYNAENIASEFGKKSNLPSNDNQNETPNATPKKNGILEGKHSGGKQKNTPENNDNRGGKQKARRLLSKKSNPKSEQQLVNSQNSPKPSAHLPSLVNSKGRFSLIEMYSDDFRPEMDSESKALEIKKMLKIESP